ncbi:Misato segment II tubulin-like domain-containing protein [Boletus edulis]|nr:Misato segment II tubulin-like domain-containing protein [Boletus edulis]
MREIIHIQAGSLSNYTGTHFWNTQENYFVYDEEDISMTDHNISFSEGRDEHNQPTLCPRLLAFDQKSNFGTLARDSHQEEALAWPTTWHGELLRQEQERIPRSEYHSRLDLEDVSEQAEPIAQIRYWSDFSRVFFDPKSIQAVPDTPELTEGDWNASSAAFSRYDDNVELMDGSLRLLVEDCNNLQGVQMIQDTSTFGGFSNSLLCAFREEHPKATIMSFSCLSSMSPLHANIGDSSQVMRVLNDTLSLRSVAEFCDLTIPILPPPQWEKNCWFPRHDIDKTSPYQTSAILSAHIETATLPLRLKGGFDDLQTIVAHLNWRKSTPFAALGGTLCPQGLSTKNLQDIASLSIHSNGRPFFARRDVSRGLSEYEETAYDAWARAHGLKEPFLKWHHLPSCPIPTSFPPIFPDARPKVLKMISSLSTSPSTGGQLFDYAQFLESAAKRRDSALLTMGIEGDEVKELVSALWDIVDEYGDNEGGGGDLGEGMDEE